MTPLEEGRLALADREVLYTAAEFRRIIRGLLDIIEGRKVVNILSYLPVTVNADIEPDEPEAA